MPIADPSKPSTPTRHRPQRTELLLRVASIEQLSPSISRFVFTDASKVLTVANESDYLKMHFPIPSANHAALATKTRSYTIRKVDESHHQVTIDFVCHTDNAADNRDSNQSTGGHTNGVAAAWAARATIGDTISAYGPGLGKPIDTSKDWFLVVGDMTSLPAIAVHLKNLPASAQGYVMIEVAHERDQQPLQLPKGMALEWIINNNYADSPSIMRNKVAEKAWLDGAYYAWIASEFDVARTLRSFLQESRNMQKGQYYISSYWKLGDTDEGNKKAKKADGGF